MTTNPHRTTAADVGALSTSGGTVSGSLSIVVPQLQDQIIEALVLGHTNASNLRLGYHQDYSLIQSHGSKPLLINGPGNNVGIGSTKNPVAKLDIASATRTGTHPTAVKGLYITGDFKDDSDGVEFRHTNGTQGIGFGSNTIYAAGSNANQDLGLKAKGTGEVKVTGKLSVTGSLSFGSSMRQMLNLWGTGHGIGVQNNTTYFRTSDNFAWYKGGSHNDAAFNAGTNGTSLMTLDVSGNLSVLGTISPAGSETNKDLVLKAKGTGKVKIDSSAIITGNVGIGTTDTKAKLDVNGDVNVSGKITVKSITTSDWIAPTLENNWLNWGTPDGPAGYFKDSLGIVHLRGIVKNGSGSTIFTLPDTYRPAYKEVHAVLASAVLGRVDIKPNGEVVVITGSYSWISLDGITFRAKG